MNALMIHALPTLLLGSLIKSTLLLLAAWAVGCLLRRASAAARHLVWSVALGSVLLLPILSLSLPRWNVAWRHVSAAAPPAPMAVPQAPPLPSAPTVASTVTQAAQPSAPASDESESPPAVTAVSRAVPLPTSGHRFSTITLSLGISLFVWLIGLLSVLCQLFVGLSRLARIEHRSIPLEHGELPMAEDVRGRMGLRRPMRFLRATEASTIAVPVTWGVLRPIVLLPAQSSAWSKDCLRAALLHELAHVQRWDWPTQLMGRFACALYWWHPLVWLATRQAREESERACDDLVLGMGMKAADYAQQLVEVVRSMPEGAPSRTVAIAMAQPSEVEGRVQAVLAKGQDRRAPSRRHVLGVMLALALGLGPVAALRLSPSARAAGGTERKLIGPMPATTQVPVADASDSWVTLPNAVTVRLLGVKDSQAGTGGWWRPDGTPVINPISKSTLVFPSLPAGVQGRTFAVETSFQVNGQPKATWAGKPSGNWNHARSVGDAHTDFVGPRLTWEFDTDHSIRSLNHYLQEQTGTAGSRSLLSQMALAVRPSDRTLTLKWGVAAGPWTQTVSCPKRVGKTSIRTSSGDVILTLLPTYHQPAVEGTRSSAVFTVTDHFYSPSPRVMANMWGNYDRVVLALDRWGRVVTQVRGTMEYTPHSAVDDSLINETTQTATIPNSVLARVASFRLLARPFQWAEFRGVQLQPRASAASTPLPATSQGQPDTAAHIALGQKLQQAGQPRDGIPEFRRAGRIDPNDAEAQVQLAQALYEIKWKHFRTPLRDTWVSFGTPPAALDEAILHMRRAVALRPNDARWHSTLATYLSNRGRHREAVAEYRRSMHLMPPLSPADIKPSTDGSISGRVEPWYDAYWTLGEALVQTGQYQEAATNLRLALRFNPSDGAHLLWLGDALNGSGHRAEARAAWRKSLAARPPKSYYQRQARARLARY